jgi:hypothetical protein
MEIKLILVFGLILLFGCLQPGSQPAPQPASHPGSKCTSINGLPDLNCTPGVTNPNVTQANIQQTICQSGYTATIRPPASYTNKLKAQGMIDYGYADTNISHYEEDHLISLELGGSPADPGNLWPEFPASPNPKDSIENLCHRMICNGSITLKDAQEQIAKDWHTACQK